jgi:hypothetical protein
MKRLEVQTEEGIVEAVRDNPNDAWNIGFPFGDRRRYGTESEIRAFINAEMKEFASED